LDFLRNRLVSDLRQPRGRNHARRFRRVLSDIRRSWILRDGAAPLSSSFP
jgi:hypothetical protein